MTDLRATTERSLSLRIGINTGEVVDRDRGAARNRRRSQRRRSARAGALGAGEILLGEATLAHVRDAVEVEPLTRDRAQGQARPGARVAARGGARRGCAPPLLGARWSAASDEIRAPAGGVRGTRFRRAPASSFTVVGDAGVGKSRLVAEFLRGALRCPRPSRALPPVWGGDHVLARRGGRATARGSARAARARPCACSDRTPRAARRRARPSARRRRSRGRCASCSRRSAVESPLVCVLDDVHWGEETFLDLVEQVAGAQRATRRCSSSAWARPELLERRAGLGRRQARTQRNVLLEAARGRATPTLLIEELVGDVPLDPRAP